MRCWHCCWSPRPRGPSNRAKRAPLLRPRRALKPSRSFWSAAPRRSALTRPVTWCSTHCSMQTRASARSTSTASRSSRSRIAAGSRRAASSSSRRRDSGSSTRQNEWLLGRRPNLRHERAPFAKGVFTFNVLASAAYSGAAFARTGPRRARHARHGERRAASTSGGSARSCSRPRCSIRGATSTRTRSGRRGRREA